MNKQKTNNYDHSGKKQIVIYLLVLAVLGNLMYLFMEDVILSYNQKMDLYKSYKLSTLHKKDPRNYELEKDKSTVTAADIELNTIGVLLIPSIGLKIPIYEDKEGYEGSPSETALSSGAALIKSFNRFSDMDNNNTKSSRVILTAHTGLSIGKLFNDLPKINIGDKLYVKEFKTNKEYVYEVSEKVIVKPEEVEKLIPKNNKEQLTLLSCYPLFINSERILVTGDRIHNVSTESFWDGEIVEKPTLAKEVLLNKFALLVAILIIVDLFKISFNIRYNIQIKKDINKKKDPLSNKSNNTKM